MKWDGGGRGGIERERETVNGGVSSVERNRMHGVGNALVYSGAESHVARSQGV